MRTEQLDYTLPSELIAQDPAAVRSESRLLVLHRATGELADSRFSRLGDFLRAGDCLVLNDTKVLPARFFARRATGGRLEGLFLHTAEMPDVWEVMLKGRRRVKASEPIRLQSRDGWDYCPARVLAKKPDGTCLLAVEAKANAEAVLAEIGFPPLPPYIHRDRDPDKAGVDRERYQTVYAQHPGAVAAPTAGLHFTRELIDRLAGQGVRFARVTLHVGAGTFKPIATENVEEHQIHHEWYRIDEENAAVINAARDAGGRIIAVGTTAVRVLETVARGACSQASDKNAGAESGGSGTRRETELADGVFVSRASRPRFEGETPSTRRGQDDRDTSHRQADACRCHPESRPHPSSPTGNHPDLVDSCHGQDGRGTQGRDALATVQAGEGTTSLFITPGYRFKIIDAMITNFHLPRSTLLALVSAFAGLEQIHKAYHHAIEQRYRFYSYGDAMLIL